eukprot:Partr_v1_DN26939_c1_g1_i2_m6596 putative Pantetheine-phosphate adenylyltransferase
MLTRLGNDLLRNKKYANQLESAQTRLDNVRKFLELSSPKLKFNVIIIHDIYGPTITEPDYQAMVVSEETLEGAKSVNVERQNREMKPLEIISIGVMESAS